MNEKETKHWKGSALALAISAAISPQLSAEDVELDTVLIEDTKVKAEANPYAQPTAPYKANRLSDSKRSRDIAETPATLTVITKDAIDESGKTELKDILSAQPGITLGTGEGGNSFGDRYIIRGYEARSDVFTDGLRDPGLISRETFALDQIEISKGPSSTFGGRGTTGGAVNNVTKKANLIDDFNILDVGLGTDKYQRYTLDSNKVINEQFAVRVNALYADSDIPDREPSEEQRQGLLLSGLYAASDELDIQADYYYYRSDDLPDANVALDRDSGEVLRYDNIAQEDRDFQETAADIFTLTFNYEIADGVRLENKTRYGETSNDYIISGYQLPRGDDGDPYARAFTGWQDNEYIGNQTNLIFDQNLWGKRHTIITGIEYADETVEAGNYDVDGEAVIDDPYNADNEAWSGTTSKSDMNSELNLKTVSIYAMDTITLSEQWEVFGGLRYDYFEYDLWTAEQERRGDVTPEMRREYDDGFWNGHLGVVFSPWQNGNVYASYSTSSNINGGEADSATNCGYGGICSDTSGNYAADPEQSTNYEIGTKWNLFDNNLLFTAAIFQTTKDDVIEQGSDSYSSEGNLNTGKNRVEGIEFGLAGNLTDKLSGQAGVAFMDSEILESNDPESIGKAKANFVDQSGYAQLKYQLTPKFAFGGAVTAASEMTRGQPDGAATDGGKLPGYVFYDAFASYKFSDQLNLRVNVLNLTDKEYYTAVYRGGGIVYVGDGFRTTANLTYKF